MKDKYNEYKMPLLRFKLRVFTNIFTGLDYENNDHVIDVSWGFWLFRYFKKAPNKAWH